MSRMFGNLGVTLFFIARVVSGQSVGDVICVEGFVMDRYCIDNVRLLDNPQEESLKRPDLHTVHCLVDVGVCVNSFYEILTQPTPGSDVYGVGWRLNESDENSNGQSSKDVIVSLARKVGDPSNFCSTCESGGLEQVGFRATILATVESTASGSTPPILSVIDAESSSVVNPNTLVSSLVADSPCQHFFGMAAFGDETMVPTLSPVTNPTIAPVPAPTIAPVPNPTMRPVPEPTTAPVPDPTMAPITSIRPVPAPVSNPTMRPAPSPSVAPVAEPTTAPVPDPTTPPVVSPTVEPVMATMTETPSAMPSSLPSDTPLDTPTDTLTAVPSNTISISLDEIRVSPVPAILSPTPTPVAATTSTVAGEVPTVEAFSVESSSGDGAVTATITNWRVATTALVIEISWTVLF